MVKNALKFSLSVLEEAGKMIREGLGGGSFTLKGKKNPLSEMDLKVQDFIISRLSKEYPGIGFLSEEREGRPEGLFWVLDPIDGTNNFVQGIPHLGISLALFEKEPLMGIILDPMREEFFWALKGEGAFMNGRRIEVSHRKDLSLSVIGLDLGYKEEFGKETLRKALELWKDVRSIRIMGSCVIGLGWVAVGRLDGYFHLNIYPWDIAAGWLIVEEAGGIVKNREGEDMSLESPSIIASTPEIFTSFLERILRES